MIDYTLTEEQKALQEMARDFALNEMRPVAAKYDQGHDFAFDVMKKAFDAGFLTCNIPEAYGGEGCPTWICPSSVKSWRPAAPACSPA